MTKQAFIFTNSKYKAGVGVYENAEGMRMVVEVTRKLGRNSFTMYLDGSDSNNITRVSADEMWKEASIYLKAPIVEVEKSYMKTHYKELTKPFEDARKEQMREYRKNNKQKESIQYIK